MSGFDNNTLYANNVDFSGSTTPSPQVTANGQLLIGSTAAPNIRVNTLTAGAGISITNASGSITIAATGGLTPVAGLIPDAHTAPGTTPVVGDGSGNITITGSQVAAGVVGSHVIRTDSLAANTMSIEIQRSAAAASSTVADNGVSHFDSGVFTVDGNGFVSVIGGSVPIPQKFTIDASSGGGTNPVVANGSGIITVSGGQVASGTVGTNVIRTDSTAANSYNIQIQRTTTAASSTVADNGVSHFDSAIFTADGNGFISLSGGSVPPSQKFNVDAHTAPGTQPVVPSATGVVTITGAQVASGIVGTNVLRTNSLAANSMTLEIQRSTAVAGSDATKNGVSHFNSSNFSVDANGFVSLISGGAGFSTITGQMFVSPGAFTYTPTASMKYVIVELVGGGGGSGGCSSTAAGGYAATSGGGGGGAYARFILTAAQVGVSLSGSVGAGGTAGAAGVNNGGAGGNTTLATAAGWTVGGGLGSLGTAFISSGSTKSVLGGAGGTVTTGTGSLLASIPGGRGNNGVIVYSAGTIFTGSGGNSQYGQGGYFSALEATTIQSIQTSGVGYGAGAGGSGIAFNLTNAGIAGSAGNAGVAIFTEFL